LRHARSRLPAPDGCRPQSNTGCQCGTL